MPLHWLCVFRWKNADGVGRFYLLALLKLRLQDLAMILHALNIWLRIQTHDLILCSGVDVAIGENVGRHIEFGLFC